MGKSKAGAPKKFNSEFFIRLVDDCCRYADEHRSFIKGKGMKSSDVYKYYLICKDEKNYPEISNQTLYKRKDFLEYLEKINRQRGLGFGKGIVKNKDYQYEDFNWMDYLENHRDQNDCGMKYIGELINGYRQDIEVLLAENEALKQKIDVMESNMNKLLNAFKKDEEIISKNKTEKINYKQKYTEVKEDLDRLKQFIDSKQENFAIFKYNKEHDIDTVVDGYTRRHSYLGEKNHETPTMQELERRFGVGSILDKDGKIDEEALEDILKEEDM